MIFDNICEAISKIEELSGVVGEPLYYRGQQCDWPITSSIHRIEEKHRKEEILKSVNFIDWLKTKKGLLKSREDNSKHTTDLDYWAIAQHYGYKTDVIDFTTDLNIAKGFALLGKEPGKVGCIFCLWEKDVEYVSSLYKKYGNHFQQDCRELLVSVGYNLFFCFDIPEISRIENQKGVFLWDVNGFATQLFSGLIDKYFPGWVEDHTFRFKQTDISVDVGNLRMIYPMANAAEMEIDRYVQFCNRDFYYKHNIIPEFPQIDCDLSSYFAENKWKISDKLFQSDPLFHYPSNGYKTEVHILDLETFTTLLNSLNYCNKFTLDWIHALNENRYVMYVSANNDMLKLFSEIINEIFSISALYINLMPSLTGIIIYQVLRLLYELVRMCREENQELFDQAMWELARYEYCLNDAKSSIEGILDSLRMAVPLDKVVKEAWEHEFLFIKLLRNSGNTSVTVLAKDIVNDCSAEYKKEHMRILIKLFDQSMIPPTMLVSDKTNDVERVRVSRGNISWDLMLNVVTKPRVLFSQEDFIRSFSYYILPWQFVMCPKRNRIYNPFEIVGIRRLDADNFQSGHIYYMGGMYYTVQ